MLRFVVLAAIGIGVVYAGSTMGRAWGVAALTVWLGLLFVTLVWLPRAAHGAFRRGDIARARLWYRVLRAIQVDRRRRAAVDVSLAACALAVDRWDEALALLERVGEQRLGEAARAAWLNNRAYALARSRRDVHRAVELAEEAVALRPDVVGFRHTRAVALLAVGRTDEAIRELDNLWGELAEVRDPPLLLEAERCYDLGRAWIDKGERDYATDYFERAHRAAPESRWAARSAEHLEPGPPRRFAGIAELVEG